MALPSTLDELGGETALRAVVERFYDLIETDPRGEHLKLLHLRGHGIAHSRLEQFDFLSGFLGGPRYYAERHGHMDIREIHAHVPISQEDAETWLELMDQALSDLGHEGPHVDRIRQTFRRVALMLINDLGDWGMRRGQ
jgi:hemoglobin